MCLAFIIAAGLVVFILGFTAPGIVGVVLLVIFYMLYRMASHSIHLDNTRDWGNYAREPESED